MRMKTFLGLAAVIAIILSASATTSVANAAILHLGNVEIGQTGSVPNAIETVESGYAYGFVDGYLPHNAIITFTYNTHTLPPGSVQAYSIYASGGPPIPLTPSFTSTAFVPSSLWPVVITLGPATAVISNMSGSAAYFTSYFLSLIGLSLPGDASSYVVSAVPLPPALILMLASMAGLGGFAARKRMAKAPPRVR